MIIESCATTLASTCLWLFLFVITVRTVSRIWTRWEPDNRSSISNIVHIRIAEKIYSDNNFNVSCIIGTKQSGLLPAFDHPIRNSFVQKPLISRILYDPALALSRQSPCVPRRQLLLTASGACILQTLRKHERHMSFVHNGHVSPTSWELEHDLTSLEAITVERLLRACHRNNRVPQRGSV